MEIELVKIIKPEGLNIIIGQSHFIKTVEDIHEMMVSSLPNAKFGLAFCEASGPRLVRTSGTCKKMILVASKNALNAASGHSFFLAIREAYPINILTNLKQIPEVVNIFAASANDLELVIAKGKEGRAILGVIDGGSPLGIENEKDKKMRKKFLRDIGYKL